MERREHDKEIEMPTTLGFSSSSSKLSSPTLAGEIRSDQPSQTHTLIFNDPHHHHLYAHLPPNQLHQSQRQTTDPDLSTSSPIATTSTQNATASNPPRTVPPPPPPPTTTTTQTAATTTTTTTTTTSTPLIRYRECLRNHAASMGSHVVDGCGEFMPSGEEGTPESLKCAACECHRNFHRKEIEGSPQHQNQHGSNYHSYYPNNKHNNGHSNTHLQFHTPPSSLHHHNRFSHSVVAAAATPSGGLVQPVMMAFGGGSGAAESSSEDLNMFHSNTVGGQQFSVLQQQQPLSKKRFRTRFTQHQKDRMMEFAEKLGWKIQKHDEQEVQQFCSQVGVKRQVFKVWMHNNKQAMKKQQQT